MAMGTDLINFERLMENGRCPFRNLSDDREIGIMVHKVKDPVRTYSSLRKHARVSIITVEKTRYVNYTYGDLVSMTADTPFISRKSSRLMNPTNSWPMTYIKPKCPLFPSNLHSAMPLTCFRCSAGVVSTSYFGLVSSILSLPPILITRTLLVTPALAKYR